MINDELIIILKNQIKKFNHYIIEISKELDIIRIIIQNNDIYESNFNLKYL